ncbi:putative ABC transport system ATP-binding protein [Microbulbifer donghaiensis]|uniref:Putative ABC transport system ATP-binding protein n=1 Tax=Microbulbifer donghaiensis TaxID=494016 RepID=A0A1M4XZQ4_9GAMM|nr:ABC transporter ATP-binding protein [Microbulbifer donghaiensis]SHE98783.1 putative ABC transport system ATP-binding protein [Microbulbifer donghaiensis]
MDHIELRALGHWFEGRSQRGERKTIHLFDNLNLTVRAGRSHAILGPSGAGKSSLLAMIAALERPKAGEVAIQLDGKVADAISLRRRSGFVFQQFHLLPELDALGNVALPLRLRGDGEAREKARHWLDRVGLSARAAHRPNQLSGGEQQRLAIARAFVAEPAFVFADEPTGNLDQHTAAYIGELLFGCVQEQGSALVLVTHSNTLSRMADCRHQLSGGRLELLA